MSVSGTAHWPNTGRTSSAVVVVAICGPNDTYSKWSLCTFVNVYSVSPVPTDTSSTVTSSTLLHPDGVGVGVNMNVWLPPAGTKTGPGGVTVPWPPNWTSIR